MKTMEMDVHIMGQNYKFRCPEHEEAILLRAAQMLDTQMQSVHGSYKAYVRERVAVFAAMTLICDLMTVHPASEVAHTLSDDIANNKIHKLIDLIDELLDPNTNSS